MYTGFYSVCPVLISGKNGLAESSRVEFGLFLGAGQNWVRTVDTGVWPNTSVLSLICLTPNPEQGGEHPQTPSPETISDVKASKNAFA